jgi:hypothetical protein
MTSHSCAICGKGARSSGLCAKHLAKWQEFVSERFRSKDFHHWLCNERSWDEAAQAFRKEVSH